ncbi:hypothetical protein [Pseudosulfitobacter pseudonitzschiae]|uniref:hypothetical protein n=1 Tax=Pseudosulfitobacter pseudonitzschiae TaxID=1402135 RepID=UPI001AF95DCD|nr:hypothetical protein [Pseudosulfitobacter pseudonitzschiae]MBM1817141.1 hypothetical protein [Pseudosulfitobacter pseudonitzschiae]MBM1834144.1 hypothetical protein [Pseudosulfitobacter pseudonitzschiae]MBM1839009.1 hypothetical protein [Pseudosulfitobacter pseudonitzschiae]MBM1843859.1 hypothetical protein [Pseudosulfitobacter pseudonitzschiae]MBM1848705.1 hypothetical protein [Pseudosulfitobacter pseudonitzschiae]
MGCDIHVVIEEKVNCGWLGVAATDMMEVRPAYAQRDYDFFGAIANVRGSGPNYPKNVPRDVSDLAWHLYMRHPTDHHSPSYMDLDDFCSIHNRLRPQDSRSEYSVEDLTGIDCDEGRKYRVVFWFDN